MTRRKSSSTSTSRRRRSLTSILLSELRRRFTRATGIPTTRAGAERKLGSLLIGLLVGLFTRKSKAKKASKTASSGTKDSSTRASSDRANEQADSQDIDSQLDARASHPTAYAEAAQAGSTAPDATGKEQNHKDIGDILKVNPPD